MEISNLVTETLSSTEIVMSNTSAVDTVPWTESRWARGRMEILRNLYATSTFASDDDCPFDALIVGLGRISLSVLHDPSDPVFQEGFNVADKLETFLIKNQKMSQPLPQPSQPLPPAALSLPPPASAETAGPATAKAIGPATAQAKAAKPPNPHVAALLPTGASNGFFELR